MSRPDDAILYRVYARPGPDGRTDETFIGSTPSRPEAEEFREQALMDGYETAWVEETSLDDRAA